MDISETISRAATSDLADSRRADRRGEDLAAGAIPVQGLPATTSRELALMLTEISATRNRRHLDRLELACAEYRAALAAETTEAFPPAEVARHAAFLAHEHRVAVSFFEALTREPGLRGAEHERRNPFVPPPADATADATVAAIADTTADARHDTTADALRGAAGTPPPGHPAPQRPAPQRPAPQRPTPQRPGAGGRARDRRPSRPATRGTMANAASTPGESRPSPG